MNRQAAILVEKLAAEHARPHSPPVNIFPLVTHCALDIICETAMGRSINAQADSDTEYVRAVYAGSEIVFKRQTFPWLWSDWFFALTPLGRRWRRSLAVLHGFTNSVIQERKAEINAAAKKEEEEKMNRAANNDHDEIGIKKRVAFLDLLIQESKGGTVLSDEDIREEVDTFMFEGGNGEPSTFSRSTHFDTREYILKNTKFIHNCNPVFRIQIRIHVDPY